MLKKEITIYTILFIGIMVATAAMVTNALTGRTLPFPALSFNQNEEEIDRLGTCSDLAINTDIYNTTDPVLSKLAAYQTACDSLPAERAMIFTDMPKDNNEAESKAVEMAERLKEFALYNITPIVIIEPASNWGLIDFTEFNTGFYDNWLHTYFQTLKYEGVTDQQLGIWTPFPEANLPLWNNHNTSPQDFATAVNKYLSITKAYFPEAHGSILLNSATYETTDFEWQNGEYVSLLPYIKDIKPELLDSFGLQGLPWLPPSNVPGPGVVDPAEYLNPALAIEAATHLSVKEIWFNTGTFQAKYTLDTQQVVGFSASKREDILTRTLQQASVVRESGLLVTINIFAEDKSQAAEATNWSYFNKSGQSTSHTTALVNFLRRAHNSNIETSLFDR